MSEQTVTN